MTFRVLRRALGVWRAQGRRARTRVLTKPVSPRAKLAGLDERWKSSGSTAKGFSPRSAAALRAAPPSTGAPLALARFQTRLAKRSACSTPHFLRDDDADASERPTPLGRAAPRGAARRRARRDVLGVPAPRADATPSSRARQPRPPVSFRDDARHAWGRDEHVTPPPPAARDPRRRKQPYVPTRVPFERPSRVPPFQPPASSRSLTFAILLHPAQRPSRVALPPRPSPRASSPPLVVRARIFDFRRRSVRLPR